MRRRWLLRRGRDCQRAASYRSSQTGHGFKVDESATSVGRAASNFSMWTIVLLTFSNIFMTFAWYGHLKYRQEALWKVILVSWGIAFFEYCLQVPGNRIGAAHFRPDQLKVIQEIITLIVFGVFTTFYFGEHLRWNHGVAALLLVGAAFFVFHTW